MTQEPVVLAVQTAAETQVGVGERHPPYTLEQVNRLRQGQTLIVDNIENADWPRPILESLLREGIRCFIRVPLIVRGELIGTLSLGAF
jgi:GAF domain-containing protein